jgi:hypothetical protein
MFTFKHMLSLALDYSRASFGLCVHGRILTEESEF